jgi:hypothetical protein
VILNNHNSRKHKKLYSQSSHVDSFILNPSLSNYPSKMLEIYGKIFHFVLWCLDVTSSILWFSSFPSSKNKRLLEIQQHFSKINSSLTCKFVAFHPAKYPLDLLAKNSNPPT